MSGLLSGLEKLGLGNLENADIYEKQNKDNKSQNVVEELKVDESDFLFERSYECPVCGAQITAKTVKTGKVKLEEADMDLRPRYQGIDILKYDVVLCEKCGFAALSRYFKNVTDMQAKLIKENITQKIRLTPHVGETYTYEEALERYKLALACAVVKRAKTSEKAYICLKAGWLLRGQAESLDIKMPDYQSKAEELKKGEMAYLKNAYEGFYEARTTEQTPICGMNGLTIDYLLAALAIEIGEFEVAGRMISTILTSSSANNRIKDKARDLKDILMEELRRK